MQLNLNDRQQQVLGATVRYYIATAKPVGSEALVDEFVPRVSPATIRNAMGHLEKAGLLYQPHTSAGRVPSDSGYRLYVDQLVTPSDTVARQIGQLLTNQLDMDGWSLEALLRGAAQILATLSGYIALITLPQMSMAHLRHLQLVLVDSKRVMLVVVLDSYETQSALMNLPKFEAGEQPHVESVERELEILSNFLNTHLRGRSLAEIASLDWSQLGQEFERYADSLKTALAELKLRGTFPVSTQILISGVAEVMRRQPEFAEPQQIQTIIQLLEFEQDQLWSLISIPENQSSTGKRVSVRIGAENPEPIRTCTLVSASYFRDDLPVGSVGMLGPTRMVYESAIALVETTADYLSEALSQT